MDGVAGHDRRARREGADRVLQPPRVAGDDLDVLEGDAELVGDDLGEDGLVALALGAEPGGDLDLAGRFDEDVAALVGADAGALDVGRQADAEHPALGRGLLLEAREVVPADELA